MGTSGNPAKRAEELKISQVGDFKKRLGGVVQLPSGLVMKLRNPGGMAAFLTAGIIPNELMLLVQEAIDKGKGVEAKDLMNEDGTFDPTLVKAMTDLMDHLVVQCAVEPSVQPTPADEQDRLDTQLYADEIPQDDKTFIFQWISGGVTDLATFRKQYDEHMETMAAESVARRNAS